ncbi:hypothetical protein [Streptomyces sclerotialus]|uniref:hypothetical protein n=1 Tax=Streptomyces sclerotialus TaxID=1957 RepID=UPI0004C619BF
MSFLRRAAAASVIAVALATCGAVPSALAAPPASSSADPYDEGPDGRPIRMGPFTFPSQGQVNGGFGWNTSGGGY